MQLFFVVKKKSRQAVVFACVMLVSLLVSLPLLASTTDAPFNQRYPVAGIHSIEAADEALTAVGKERAIIEARYIEEQRLCYRKFFVSSCLEGAKDRNRMRTKQMREVEVSANVYKRQAKADERDKFLGEQRIKDEQDAVRRTKDQQDKAAISERKEQERADKQHAVSAREAQTAGRGDERVKAHQAKLRSAEAAATAEAPQRAINIQIYQEKVKAAELHRQDVEGKKTAKDSQRAVKQAQVPTISDPSEIRSRLDRQ